MPAEQQIITGIACADCGDLMPQGEDEGVRHGSNVFCWTCSDDNVHNCAGCGENYLMQWTARIADLYGYRHMSMYTTTDTQEFLCERCTHFCDDCGDPYEYEGNMTCCRNRNHIHYYSYRPVWKYWDASHGGEATYVRRISYPSKLYMGIELEIEKMDEDVIVEFLRTAKEDLNGGEPSFCYFKEDGSLSSRGAELVTMPATLEGFKTRFPFDALVLAQEMGARSFYYTSCGFHIHVSRTAFTPSHMYKFIKFHMRNDRQCMVVGQRDWSNYATWDEHHTHDLRKNTAAVVKRELYTNRYSAINTGNHDTIELRYFKGNIKPESVLKNVEFVDCVYEYTKQLTVSSIWSNGYSWDVFIEYLVENKEVYMNLYNFLTSVNPVTEEHEMMEEF